MRVKLGAYAIDALPHPNDPGAPFRVGASIDEAARLCAERGARLCELAWERACKGPDGDVFATGAHWSAACEKDGARCASGYRVRATGRDRGADEQSLRGCGGGGRAAGVAWRRCGVPLLQGVANGARASAIESRPPFKKTSLEPAQLAKIFAQVPELARIGSEVRYFTAGDVRAMTPRGGSVHEGVTFLTRPLLWSPEHGAALLVVAGRGKTMSFVVALWTLPGDRYRFGSSFLMLDDLSPVALAFESTRRKELRWTSCWGCNGEQGFVSGQRTTAS